MIALNKAKSDDKEALSISVLNEIAGRYSFKQDSTLNPSNTRKYIRSGNQRIYMCANKSPNSCQTTDCMPIRFGTTHSGFFVGRRRALTCLLFTFLMLITLSASALSSSLEHYLEDDPNEQWHITADRIDYDRESSVYVGTGNVSITKNDKKLTADLVHFDHKAMTAFAQGHVMMTAGEDVIIGDRMEIDLRSETGTIYNGRIFIKENHFYIKGDTLQKVGKNAYAAQKATISTCDGDNPAWKITGRNLKVTIEGYGFVNHAALWVKKVPVLYTPFFAFPVKLKRQTGLLPPQTGYSDRKGVEYIQPFFWAINESSDATLYADYMSRRGTKFGLEYRYVLDPRSKGALMGDFLDDRKVDDGSPGSDDYGYDDDNVMRPNSDRYWFRMKQNQAMPWGISAKLDLDIVSDQDYLHDFKDKHTGFNEAEAYFFENFGRGLDADDDPVRVNRFNLNKRWAHFDLNVETRWYDNVIIRRQQETDPTLQKLPFVLFDASKQQLFQTPFYLDLDSEYTHFFREDGPRGHRADVHPRLYLPYKFKNYFTIEPSAGVRQTVWHMDQYDNTSADKDRTLYRNMADMKVDLFSEISRAYSVNGEKIKGIKHAFRSQITYDYMPGKEQDKFPLFDSIDRIDTENRVTYSITNIFTSKTQARPAGIEGSRNNENDEPPAYTYSQFARFKLENRYDIQKKRDDDPEPFSPIFGELDIYPNGFLTVDADAAWSPYESHLLSSTVSASIWDKRGDMLSAAHSYTRDSNETISANLRLKVSDRIAAYAEYERNLNKKRTIRSGIGFTYTAQCWSIDFGYAYEDGNTFSFMINLFGF
ncbi:LPS-assembly protein LptD [Thermodesulfobacteriota bacterium]